MMMKKIQSTSLAIALLASSVNGVERDTSPLMEVIQVHEIAVDPVTGFVTLRWNSQFGSSYAIEESVNPAFGWQGGEQNVFGDPFETTFSFLPHQSNDGGMMRFFRIRKMEGIDPGEIDLQAVSSIERELSTETSEDGTQNTDADEKSEPRKNSARSIGPRKIPSSPLERLVVR